MANFSILWPKKAIFATRGAKYSIWNRKHGQTLTGYVLWYCPSDENHLHWIGHNLMAFFLAFYGQIILFLPSRDTKHSILKQKSWSKWSKLYQTMCFDTSLQMKIIYSGLVIILWPFLAFCCPQKRFFLPPEEKSTQFWNRKHGQKWSKPNQTMCFKNCPSYEHRLY